MRTRKSILYSFILVIGVLILVNILSGTFFLRLDFTADREYTLSHSTKEILKSLKEPVTVTAYFSEDVPPELVKARRDFKDLLTEYASVSHNKVKFEFIDPSGKEELEQKAKQSGMQPVTVGSRQKNQVKQQLAYLGAVVQMGERTEVIPVIQPGAAMEYALSSAIKKISVVEKPLVGFLQGNGEPSVSAMSQVYNSLSVMYQVDPVFFSDTANNLAKYKTIAIVAPKDTLKAAYFQQLDKFLQDGGRLLVAFNRVEGNLSQGAGTAINPIFAKWLETKGILVEEDFVADASCGLIGIQEQQMGFTLTRQLEFHYFPVFRAFPKHPVTEGLEAMVLNFASTIKFKGDPSKTFTPLLVTSEKSTSQPVPVTFDLNREWKESDFKMQNLVVAGAVEGKFGSSTPSKMIVISDGDFAVNGEGQQAQEVVADNVNFFVNCIDWLSDDTGLIELRTKGVTSRPLTELSDSTKLVLKLFNFLLPIILIIAYGVWRMNNNRKIREQRKETSYV